MTIRLRSVLIGAALLVMICAPVVLAIAMAQDEPVETGPLPESRAFAMGFTPWPYDFTLEAVQQTYVDITQAGDLICHHLDDGVPWREALDGEDFPAPVEESLLLRLRATPASHVVYLACTPMGLDRKSLASRWDEESNMERTGEWAEAGFDDPRVIEAYGNWCLRLIERFEPDYFCYGIEVDADLSAEDPSFPGLVALFEATYRRVKTAHPELPTFLSFCTQGYGQSAERRRAVDEALEPYTDLVAISTYPFVGPALGGQRANPEPLPDTWLQDKAAFAPGKPIAVAETGFMAEDLVMETHGVHIEGRPEWQAAYVRKLLRAAQAADAEFVVWFNVRDYDQAWDRLAEMGLDEVFKTWRDCGLKDGEGAPRPAMKVWGDWLDVPRG
ncbi:MAG: hypothetical protein GF320_06470 [Armatimonadia bacterium]|nr:hypothetical protein [Armatimonadia bacterium]